MLSFPGRFAILTATLLAVIFVVPTQLIAENHVVSQAEIQKQAVQASQQRQQSIDKLSNYFAESKAQDALKGAKIDPAKVKTAIATLSDEELSQLSSRADRAQADFAAGRISDRDLLLILVGIAVLVLIIVAVR